VGKRCHERDSNAGNGSKKGQDAGPITATFYWRVVRRQSLRKKPPRPHAAVLNPACLKRRGAAYVCGYLSHFGPPGRPPSKQYFGSSERKRAQIRRAEVFEAWALCRMFDEKSSRRTEIRPRTVGTPSADRFCRKTRAGREIRLSNCALCRASDCVFFRLNAVRTRIHVLMHQSR